MAGNDDKIGDLGREDHSEAAVDSLKECTRVRRTLWVVVSSTVAFLFSDLILCLMNCTLF